MVKEVNSPVNSMRRPQPPVDVKSVLRSSNPKHASPYCGEQGPKAPASSTPIPLPTTK
jgi:hypothetical protein